ncbi:hypothetical protein OCU04_001130 [Sclerotinia nivalis]|uniref:Myb-like domain-containing protein n=1 Tax=Sclerotinia nivalis TaxID=352851 RepID=A0A9X0AY35_9HELO|nr:hypothetical protein OCU04_001130 [Sclerotinia nivalis]
MEPKSDPTSLKVDPYLLWTEQEENILVQLVKKHQKRVDNSEISMNNLFDEVSIELNKLGIGIQKANSVCKKNWSRIHDGQSNLHLKGRTSDKYLDADLNDAEGDSTDGDEDSRSFDDKIVGDQKKKRISRVWTREESRIIYQMIEIQKLKEQEGSPCLSGSERFAIASAQLKEKG